MQEPAVLGGEQQWITPSEMARMLAIGKTKVYEILANNSDIETIRLGRAIRIKRGNLMHWIDRQGCSKGERLGSDVEGNGAGRITPSSIAGKKPLEILLNPKEPGFQEKVEAVQAGFGEKYAAVEYIFPEMAVLKVYPGGATELPR